MSGVAWNVGPTRNRPRFRNGLLACQGADPAGQITFRVL